MLVPTGAEGKYEYDPSVPAGTGGGGGSGSGEMLIVHQDEDTGALDMTWKQIDDALSKGLFVCIMDEEYDGHQIRIISSTAYYSEEGKYYVYGMNGGQFVTESQDGYPEPDGGVM